MESTISFSLLLSPLRDGLCAGREETRRHLAARAAPPGDGGDYQHFITVFKCIGVLAQKTNIFVVDIKVDKAAHLAVGCRASGA